MTSKKEIGTKILALLKTLPKDRIQHTANFKESQIARFLNENYITGITEKDLQLQYLSLRDLVNDKYKNYYKLDEKLIRPKGNPHYYERLLTELKGESKETLFTAIKTVIFGK